MSTLRQSEIWQSLSPDQRLALMGALEADNGKGWLDSARNTISANANRAAAQGWDTDRVLNYKAPGKAYGWFQPLDEPAQLARAIRILGQPEFRDLVAEAQGQRARIAGAEGALPDRVNGGTHYLAHASTMRALEQKQPTKYRDWGPNGSNWSGYDPALGDYRSKTAQDDSHAFIAPGGSKVAPPTGAGAVAQATTPAAPAIAGAPGGVAAAPSLPPELMAALSAPPAAPQMASAAAEPEREPENAIAQAGLAMAQAIRSSSRAPDVGAPVLGGHVHNQNRVSSTGSAGGHFFYGKHKAKA